MKKPAPLYRIETFYEHDQTWHQLLTWWAMPRGKADGAWMVLKAFNGGGKRYRLLKNDAAPYDRGGVVVEEHHTGNIQLN